MIVVKLDGRLGNQMFQYAFGRFLSHFYKLPLKLDITSLPSLSDYSLDIFNHPSLLASKEDIAIFDRRGLSYYKKLTGKLRNIFSPQLYLEEPDLFENLRLPKRTRNLCAVGHWQSELYFKEIDSVIRADFSFPDIIDEDNLFLQKLITECNSISVHIRRGDYLRIQNQAIHGVLPITYYRNAISLVSQEVSEPIFFIFSDDPEWAKSNLAIKEDAVYVSDNIGKNAYKDMYLMTLCKHNIVANSSFSWWGAWLNKSNDKIVVAPKNWYNDPSLNRRSKEIIPSRWKMI